MVRCKLMLVEVTSISWSSAKRLKFSAVYDQTIEEDRRFAKYSPSGSFEILVDNPAAVEQFELGKSYYFDAIPCEE